MSVVADRHGGANLENVVHIWVLGSVRGRQVSHESMEERREGL
jgi:hypothetical protein